MKKLLITMLAAAMFFSLSACTDKTEGKEDGAGDPSAVTETGNTGETQNSTDDMFSDVDVDSLPEKESGKKTVDESFSKLSDKLVAGHSDDNFTMVLTFYFEDGKAVGGFVEGTYKNVAQAKTVYDSYLKNADYYANVKRDGGTITYTQTEKGFEAYKGLTKDEIKKSVEESGFEVTEE